MADWFANTLRALKLAPEPLSSEVVDSVLADLNGRAMPQLDQRQRYYEQGILNQKNIYDEALKQFNNPESTEEQKTAAQERMNQAHKDAEHLRQVGTGAGYNLNNYGSNIPLEQANINNEIATERAINDIFTKDLTPDQYYNRLVDNLRRNGATKGQAERIAAKKTQDYAIDRQAKFNTAMQMYGTNGDGSLNNLAMQMIGLFSNDLPELANIYGTGYATPSKQYDNLALDERARVASNRAFENAYKLAEQQFKYGFANRADSAKWNDFINSNNAARDINKIGYSWNLGQIAAEQQRRIEENKSKLEAQAKAAEEHRKSPEFKYKQTFDAAMIATGGDFNMSSAIAFGETFKDYINQNKNSVDDRAAQQKIATAFNGQHGAIEYLLSLGTEAADEQVRKSIEQIKTSILGEDGKYQEWLDYEDVQKELERLNLYEKALNKEISYQELINKLNGKPTETQPEQQNKLSAEELKQATKNQNVNVPFGGNTYNPSSVYIPGSAGATIPGGR